MDGRGEHSSWVDNDLGVTVKRGFLVQVSQDVHPGHILPAGALLGQSLGGGRRQLDGVGEHVILKQVTQVSPIFIFQQRQKRRPTGKKRKNILLLQFLNTTQIQAA